MLCALRLSVLRLQVRGDVRSLTDLLTCMLRYDPAQRLSAHACLQHSFFQVGWCRWHAWAR